VVGVVVGVAVVVVKTHIEQLIDEGHFDQELGAMARHDTKLRSRLHARTAGRLETEYSTDVLAYRIRLVLWIGTLVAAGLLWYGTDTTIY
jgi:hypothetical protein